MISATSGVRLEALAVVLGSVTDASTSMISATSGMPLEGLAAVLSRATDASTSMISATSGIWLEDLAARSGRREVKGDVAAGNGAGLRSPSR